MSFRAVVLSVIRHGPNILLYPGAFDPYPRAVCVPSMYGLPYEDVMLTTSDHVNIRAYLLLQPNPGAPVETPKGPGAMQHCESECKELSGRPTVLMFHGNAENIGHTLPLAHAFYSRLRCHVFMLSPRGFGLSEGHPSTKGLMRDSKAALEYILKHPVLSKTSIIVYGQSMGGALAIDLASRNHTRIKALVVENTYISLRSLIPDVLPLFSIFAPFFRQWNSVARIRRIPMSLPILMLSGELDEVIPCKHMKCLWDAANPNGSEREGKLVVFAEGQHNNTWDQPGYWDAISQFIDGLSTSS